MEIAKVNFRNTYLCETKDQMEIKTVLFGAVIVKDEKMILLAFIQKLLRGIRQFISIHLVLSIKVCFKISDTAFW